MGGHGQPARRRGRHLLLRDAARKARLPRIDAPVLGHFGTADEFVPVDDAKAHEQEMESAGVNVRFEFYEGAGHAFFNDTGLGTA